MAEVERLLPHESSKRPDFELVQSPERRPVFGAARVPVVGDRHLRQMRDGQRRQSAWSAPACSTDLGQWLQVIEHQVRQPARRRARAAAPSALGTGGTPERMLATATLTWSTTDRKPPHRSWGPFH